MIEKIDSYIMFVSINCVEFFWRKLSLL